MRERHFQARIHCTTSEPWRAGDAADRGDGVARGGRAGGDADGAADDRHAGVARERLEQSAHTVADFAACSRSARANERHTQALVKSAGGRAGRRAAG